MEKIFRTHDELILLLESRGMDFSGSFTRGDAKKALQRRGYYNLVNGYKDIFIDDSLPDERFKEGTTLAQLIALYNFDEELRHIFFKNILYIETNTKSLIAYEFSKVHGHKNFLTHSNFKNDSNQSIKHVSDLIAEIQRQLANRVKDPSIIHYLTKHGYVPLWVLNNILTLGTVSKFYSLMKQPEKQKISKTFSIDDKTLESLLFYLSKVRNFCAHGNRLYCFRSQDPISDTPVHSNMNIPKGKNKEYIFGKRDLFAALIAMKMLLSKRDFSMMCNDIQEAIKELETSITTISSSEVLSCMGFPEKWRNIRNASKTIRR